MIVQAEKRVLQASILSGRVHLPHLDEARVMVSQGDIKARGHASNAQTGQAPCRRRAGPLHKMNHLHS